MPALVLSVIEAGWLRVFGATVRHDLLRVFERQLVRYFATGVARAMGLGVVGVVVVVLVLSPGLRKLYKGRRQ